MKHLRHIAHWMALMGSLLLGSCIDSREEFWLEANGSGRAQMQFSIPTSAASMCGGNEGIRRMIDHLGQSGPTLHHFHHTITTKADRTRIDISFAFDSPRDLEALREGEAFKTLPGAATHMAGEVKTEIHGLSVDYQRTIAVGKAMPGAFLLPESKFAGCHLLTIMHLPVVASRTNATRVENGGRTLIWDTPMAKAVKSPVIHQVEFPIPIPRVIYLGLAALVIIAGILTQRRRAKLMRKRAFVTGSIPAP